MGKKKNYIRLRATKSRETSENAEDIAEVFKCHFSKIYSTNSPTHEEIFRSLKPLNREFLRLGMITKEERNGCNKRIQPSYDHSRVHSKKEILSTVEKNLGIIGVFITHCVTPGL